MATNIITKTLGKISRESGNGVPTHTVKHGSTFTDISTSKHYTFTTGNVWVEETGGGSGGATLNLSLDLQNSINNGYVTANFTYTNDSISLVEYKNGSGVNMYTKAFTYTGEKVTQILLTRVSDSATLTTTFTYTGEILTSTSYS